jgi:altronate dehydratase
MSALVIHPRDNVAVALKDLKQGETLVLADGRAVSLLSDVPFSHKVALADIGGGQEIIKYGENIGEAKEDIRRGQWVHTHNLTIDEKG